MNAWGEWTNAHGASHDALATHVMNLARSAVEVEGLQTLLLPAERVTAVHEAGHAVLYGAQSNPLSRVRIWPHRAGQGYADTCDFPPDAPTLYIYPLQQPHQALALACVILAGWAAGVVVEDCNRKSPGLQSAPFWDHIICNCSRGQD